MIVPLPLSDGEAVSKKGPSTAAEFVKKGRRVPLFGTMYIMFLDMIRPFSHLGFLDKIVLVNIFSSSCSTAALDYDSVVSLQQLVALVSALMLAVPLAVFTSVTYDDMYDAYNRFSTGGVYACASADIYNAGTNILFEFSTFLSLSILFLTASLLIIVVQAVGLSVSGVSGVQSAPDKAKMVKTFMYYARVTTIMSVIFLIVGVDMTILLLNSAMKIKIPDLTYEKACKEEGVNDYTASITDIRTSAWTFFDNLKEVIVTASVFASGIFVGLALYEARSTSGPVAPSPVPETEAGKGGGSVSDKHGDADCEGHKVHTQTGDEEHDGAEGWDNDVETVGSLSPTPATALRPRRMLI